MKILRMIQRDQLDERVLDAVILELVTEKLTLTERLYKIIKIITIIK